MIQRLKVLCFMFSKVTCFNATEGMLQIDNMEKSCQLGSQLILFVYQMMVMPFLRCAGIFTK
jgi:hypothetical protein